jgi:hypothetical protein
MIRFSLLLLVCSAFIACDGAADLYVTSDQSPPETPPLPPERSPSRDSGTIDGFGGGATMGTGSGDAGMTPPTQRPSDDGGATLSVDAGFPVDAGRTIADGGTQPPDAGNNECGTAKLCESFESYPTSGLANNSMLGPWRVRVSDNRGAVSIDSSRAASGQKAIKVRIESGAASGGRIHYNAGPLFASPRPQLYGRMKIFMGADGSSVHWTMFAASGVVPPGSAASGHRTNYLYSSFQQQGTKKNLFGAVFSDNQTGQDCYQGTSQFIPTNRWACVAFSFDGAALKYRLWLDGAAVPGGAVNTTGAGCVSHPPQTPWYGPRFDEFYVGAWSWHPMSAPMELWIDDVVLDDQPVSCP